ncbi:MAG: zinc ribbon domain-containing protein [Anaerolineaceae bacterium]|nr:zinc ribbon domain-containing protein [Anaerolineaceae bacterium]
MPIYEYHCKSCNSTFEKMIRWSEADRSPVCPNCQAQDTQKKLSNFASIGNQSSGSATSSSCGSSGRFS